MAGFRHTIESPRYHFPEAELWVQSTSARAWDWNLYDWSRWWDLHSIEPQSFYPGIRIMRPDVLAWYYKQGSERPIYFTQKYPEILASQAYPIERITEQFGDGFFGCQLDYMGALALDEGFDRWILYGVGQPYTADRMGEKARHWFAHHGTFLHWLRIAKKRGVEIILDTPESNMFTHAMIDDDAGWPVPGPLTARYGYDMHVPIEQVRATQTAEYPFHQG